MTAGRFWAGELCDSKGAAETEPGMELVMEPATGPMGPDIEPDMEPDIEPETEPEFEPVEGFESLRYDDDEWESYD